MGQRIAIEHVTSFELALGRLAMRGVVAVLTAGQNINHVGWMRVHLLFNPRRQFGFENAHPIVLEFYFYRLGIYDRRILRRDGGCPDDEGKGRDNGRNNESHGYEKAFLESQLQAVNDNSPALQRWACAECQRAESRQGRKIASDLRPLDQTTRLPYNR